MAATHQALTGDVERSRRGRAWGTPVNLTHAHVAREKKPPTRPPAKPKPAPPAIAPPAVEKPQPESLSGATDVVLIHGNTCDFEAYRIVVDYDGLCEAFSDRVEDLQATRLGVDAAGRFAGGHASTLLCNPQIKRYGPTSLSKMLAATGLVIVLAIDEERFAKVKERLGRRERPLRSPARGLESPSVRQHVQTEGSVDPTRGRQVSWKHGILRGFYFASANPPHRRSSDGTAAYSLRSP
jgi:hypothetical protein